MSTLPLFEEPPPEQAARLAPALRQLASEGIYIGTSSWKYEGWIGQIYSRERYLARGRFSKKKFEAECLDEYAKTFHIVCGDFSFYQFPSAEFWERLFHSAPPTLQFAFKVPDEITLKRFPSQPRFGPRAGLENETYLNDGMFSESFLRPLEAYRRQVAVLIFEFGTFAKQTYAGMEEFLADLDPFLSALPPDHRYAVEIRNSEYLVPEYFACLQNHGVAHVFNAWTRMPDLAAQLAIPQAFTAGFTVTRGLLRRGRPYADAVKKFSPYLAIQDPNPRARQAMRRVIATARERRTPSYIFVNNRLEGNAPATIEAIVQDD